MPFRSDKQITSLDAQKVEASVVNVIETLNVVEEFDIPNKLSLGGSQGCYLERDVSNNNLTIFSDGDIVLSAQNVTLPGNNILGGSSSTGEKGDKGDRGVSGLNGLSGDKGIKGDSGVKGVKGMKGDSSGSSSVTIQDNSITSEMIQNNAVTTDKLINSSVTESKLKLQTFNVINPSDSKFEIKTISNNLNVVLSSDNQEEVFSVKGESGDIYTKGNIDCEGSIQASQFTNSSDDRLKDDSTTTLINSKKALESLCKLKPVTYDKYNCDVDKAIKQGIRLDESKKVGKESGFIAQDVLRNGGDILKHTVIEPFDKESDFYSINYIGYVAYLTSSIQELNKRLIKAETEIENIKNNQ